MSHTEFFYRIAGLSLVPGSKTAGFTLIVSTEALQRLSKVKVGKEEYMALTVQIRERIARAGLLPKKILSGVGIALSKETACPLMFTTNPMFGSSISTSADTLYLMDEDYRLELIGPTMDYTPHNVDTPAHAMALLIMVETWGEWAQGKLAAGESAQSLQQKAAAWAQHALPPEANHLNKLKKELEELEERPDSPEEMADVCLALMLHADKHGVDLLDAAAEKFLVVQTGDYGPCDAEGVSLHI